MAISIHAPTRGATITIFANFIFHIISIHAPTRGATITIFANFIFHIISIHAPTRGATGGVLYVNCVTRYFNPRSHKGSDSIGSRSTKAVSYFNPRSHKGSDISRGCG